MYSDLNCLFDYGNFDLVVNVDLMTAYEYTLQRHAGCMELAQRDHRCKRRTADRLPDEWVSDGDGCKA